MPVDLLMLGAAFLTGLIGSVHCLVMCGGVATGLAAASHGRDDPRSGTGRAALRAAVALNTGRVLGYTLAGALVGGFGTAILSVLDAERLILGLRLAVGIVLVLVGLRLIDGRDRLGRIGRIGQAIWPALRRLGRGLLPADRFWKQLALGGLWGWLPCGLSWSMLLAALFTVDVLHGALTMAAFGSGTLLAMIPLTWDGSRNRPPAARSARWSSPPAPSPSPRPGWRACPRCTACSARWAAARWGSRVAGRAGCRFDGVGRGYPGAGPLLSWSASG